LIGADPEAMFLNEREENEDERNETSALSRENMEDMQEDGTQIEAGWQRNDQMDARENERIDE
jgi:hypothetical protein